MQIDLEFGKFAHGVKRKGRFVTYTLTCTYHAKTGECARTEKTLKHLIL